MPSFPAHLRITRVLQGLRFSIWAVKSSAEPTSLVNLVPRKVWYVSGLHGRNAGFLMDSDSPLANSEGWGMKCPRENVSPCYSMSQADAEGACSHHTHTVLRCLDPPADQGQARAPQAVCQEVAHQWVSSAEYSVKPGSLVSYSVKETWPAPYHLPLEKLPRNFLALGSMRAPGRGSGLKVHSLAGLWSQFVPE